jgi:hypothetical protein
MQVHNLAVPYDLHSSQAFEVSDPEKLMNMGAPEMTASQGLERMVANLLQAAREQRDGKKLAV